MILQYRKPRGCVTARRDARWRCVLDDLPENLREQLSPVGRLDLDTEGLLLLTDDGQLLHRLTAPACAVEKTYAFLAYGTLTPEAVARLAAGAALFGSGEAARPAFVTGLRYLTVREAADSLPPEERARAARNPNGAVSAGCIRLTEGKRHEVKLLLRGAGCRVFALTRLSMGGLTLDPALAPGEWRPLTRTETEALYRAAGYPAGGLQTETNGKDGNQHV